MKQVKIKHLGQYLILSRCNLSLVYGKRGTIECSWAEFGGMCRDRFYHISQKHAALVQEDFGEFCAAKVRIPSLNASSLFRPDTHRKGLWEQPQLASRLCIPLAL